MNPYLLTRYSARTIAMILAMLFVACGDFRHSQNQPSEGAVPAFAPPVADFELTTVPIEAGTVVHFDATPTLSASTNLIYSWDFGDGRRGGTERIGQLFPLGGNFNITLTVTDEFGQSDSVTKTLRVNEADFPDGTFDHHIKVINLDGVPLVEARVSIPEIGIERFTNHKGELTLNQLPSEREFGVIVEKPGYSSIFTRTKINEKYLPSRQKIRMLPIGETIRIPSIENGGVLTAKDGASVIFPARSVVRLDGSPVTGSIDVDVTIYEASSQEHLKAFPTYEAINNEGNRAMLVTHGAMDITLRQNGERLQLAPQKAATITIPLYTEGAISGTSIDLWALDELAGIWIQEGYGTVVPAPNSPTGLALEGLATHFTLWNADTWINTPCELEIQFTCTNNAGEVVPLSNPNGVHGDVTVNVSGVKGLGDSCTPLNIEKGKNNKRAPLVDVTFVDPFVHDPTMLEGTHCKEDYHCVGKMGNGQPDAVPPNVYCKKALLPTTCSEALPNALPADVGVCAKVNSECTEDYMYCDRGKCTLPYYRYSLLTNYVNVNGSWRWGPLQCHDDPEEFLRDNNMATIGHPDIRGVAYMQNWEGFTSTATISNDGIAHFPHVPRTYLSLEASKIYTDDYEFHNDGPVGRYEGELANIAYQVLPTPGGPPTSAGQRMQDMPTQCFDEFNWHLGSCEECEPRITCGQAQAKEIPNILIVMDTSSSMAGSSLTQAKAGLDAVFDDTNLNVANKARFGLVNYPVHAGPGTNCNTPDTPNLSMGLHSASDIKATYDSYNHYGSTPTAQTLAKIVPGNWLSDPSDPNDAYRDKNILLITDGAPNCGGNIKTAETEARKIYEQHGIKVHVLAYNYSSHIANMNRLAAAGGTGQAITANDAQSLVAAFSQIISEIGIDESDQECPEIILEPTPCCGDSCQELRDQGVDVEINGEVRNYPMPEECILEEPTIDCCSYAPEYMPDPVPADACMGDSDLSTTYGDQLHRPLNEWKNACVNQANCSGIVIECEGPFMGVNNLPQHCEIDALVVERLNEAININNLDIEPDGDLCYDHDQLVSLWPGFSNPPANRTALLADLSFEERLELLQTVDYDACQPDPAEPNYWTDRTFYIKYGKKVIIDYERPLQEDDVIRIYRQGVPASQMNENMQRCQASGMLNVLMTNGATLAEDIFNTQDIRLTEENLTP